MTEEISFVIKRYQNIDDNISTINKELDSTIEILHTSISKLLEKYSFIIFNPLFEIFIFLYDYKLYKH